MTIIGFILALAIFAYAILSDTRDLSTYFNPHAIAIVVGGTFSAALIAYRMPEILNLLRGMWVVFRMPIDEHPKYIALFREWSDVVRLRGLSAIEPDVEALPPSFARDGLELLINGFRRDEIAEVLESNIKNLVLRERIDSNIFKTMAMIAPAFGLVGTLIGLILMLKRLDDVTKIAPAMSTAMTATFYGVIAANLVFLPISVKLARRTEVKVQFYRMIMDGILMLYDKRPGYYVEEKMNSYLPPRLRTKAQGGAPVRA
jgi:chemotaxis protein MotA